MGKARRSQPEHWWILNACNLCTLVQVELEAENQKAAAEVRRQQQVLWRTNADANRVSQALHNAQAATEVAKVGQCFCIPQLDAGHQDGGLIGLLQAYDVKFDSLMGMQAYDVNLTACLSVMLLA